MHLYDIVVRQIKKTPFGTRHLWLYIVSGVTALVIDYLIFISLYFGLEAPLSIAVPAGLSGGLIASFTLNKYLTFSETKRTNVRRTVRQVALYLALFIFNNVFTVYAISLMEGMGLSAAYAKLITTLAITLWNFVLYKRLIFR